MATSSMSDMDSSSLYNSSEYGGEEGSEADALVPPPSSWFESSNDTSDALTSMDTNDNTVERESQEDGSSTEEINNIVAGMKVPLNPTNYTTTSSVGRVHPSPSWREISSQVLPAAARELLSSSLRQIYYTARLSYSKGRWRRKHSDMGNKSGGFSLASSNIELPSNFSNLPPFSSLPWVDRQLVKEWRTYLPETPDEVKDDEEFDFERARALVPNPIPRPSWRKTDVCHACHKPFGPTRLRHHCRLCGYSFCHTHSPACHSLPHLGYDPDVPERVCEECKRILLDQNLAERVAWRLARYRDFKEQSLTPYFETGIDSVEEVARRITRAAIAMAKSIPLGAQATVAVETVDVLRKYGLQGIYGIMLRQEFLAAADLLQKALGINKTAWPLSVHELTAAIFYALAQHRAMRGLNPEQEHVIHRFRSPSTEVKMVQGSAALNDSEHLVGDQSDTFDLDQAIIDQLPDSFEHSFDSSIDPSIEDHSDMIDEKPSFIPVCDPVPDSLLTKLVFYAPIAMNFIYSEKEVEMQLLAAQQGWRLLYAFLDQCNDVQKLTDRPASALFLHEESKIVCLAVRGTATINDVVTDIRQIPVPFPDNDPDNVTEKEEDWTSIFTGQGLALCGMASAAVNLFREHIDSIIALAKDGYKIRLTGHSLGGGVATMIAVLVLKHLENYPEFNDKLKAREDPEDDLVRVYAYGTPSCVDAKLANSVNPFVTTTILHDDVVPRLTPTSCRGLLKHLLHIRETWVKTHMEEDLRAVGKRASQVWAPRFRQNFTLTSSKSIKKYCKRQIQIGKSKLMATNKDGTYAEEERSQMDSSSFSSGQWGEKLGISVAPSFDSKSNIDEEEDHLNSTEETGPQFLLEFLGGIDNRVEGIVIDGDEFFDTGENLVEDDTDASDTSSDIGQFHDAVASQTGEGIETHDSWSTGSDPQPKDDFSPDDQAVNSPGAVVLEESPLPRMFIPGQIIHIYSHRGVYKCAYVPRTFRELRRISLAGNCLTNHTTKAYYEGLLEVQTARAAPEGPPRWTAFDEDDTCSCCASRFTWASTSNSEAQEARDKHNCRSCGGLVCDPCAKHRVPVPSIGVTVPVRVCDRCYNDVGSLSVTSPSIVSSSPSADQESSRVPINSGVGQDVTYFDNRPERTRGKRSAVVDDLASRIRSSALTTYL